MNFKNYRSLLAAFSAAVLWLAAASTPPAAGSPDRPQIVIKNFMFTPVKLTIKVGSVVTWVNQDDEPHTVVSDTGLFRSGAIDTGETSTFKFDKPGTYRFICSIHKWMAGTIVVD